MEKITIREFEELILKDEELTAKAKEITGEGEELQEKVAEFAASLGYELDTFEETDGEVNDPDELESVAGGKRPRMGGKTNGASLENCFEGGRHNWVFVKTVPGMLWGQSYLYKCSKFGQEGAFPYKK